MDEKLTHKIQDYLDTPPSERDVVAGATLLLSLNRNKILFQNVIRKPEKFADKVEYELRKHLKIRLDGKTVSDIALMNITVIPSAQRIIDGGVRYWMWMMSSRRRMSPKAGVWIMTAFPLRFNVCGRITGRYGLRSKSCLSS